MWEIIRKNKIKSFAALFVMMVWYTIIYGIICAILLIVLISCNTENISDSMFIPIFAIGVLIAFLIFIIRFSIIKNKPYEIGSCCIYPINKAKNKQVYNIVEEITIASGSNIAPKLYILNSNILNAYACGFSPKSASIVVSKGLLETLSRDELQGVIAHEMSHIVNRDTTYLLCSGALFTISAAFSAFFMESLRGKGNSKGVPILLILLIMSLLGQGICFLLFMFISRKREYLADACASQYTRYPKGLADALLKIENNSKNDNCMGADNLVKASFIAPQQNDSLFSTHPSTQNRIKILMNMTTADYKEYEKEFQKINNTNLIPKTALQNSKSIPIKKTDNTELNMAILSACALNNAVSNQEQAEIIKENKEILKENIKKHREVENLVRDLAGYKVINCECATKLSIPPIYNNTVIVCPHCKKKHAVK